MPEADSVLISEVGPRGGLQSVARTMPTGFRLAWIDALCAAGLPKGFIAATRATERGAVHA